MRNVIIIALLSAATGAPGLITAQTPYHTKNAFTTYRGHSATMRLHPVLQARKIAAKTTATDARLISTADLRYNGSDYDPTDSTTYSYTGTRGGAFDADWMGWMWKGDVSYHYNYDLSASTYDPADTKVSYTYDASDNLTSETDQNWNSSASSWDNSSRYVYTYNTSGDMVADTSYIWNTSTSAWENDARSTYTYSATHKMMSAVQQQWNTSTMAWEDMWQTTITRDASDRITLLEGQFSVGTTWENALRLTYTYDAPGNRTSEMQEWWSGTAYDTSSITVHSSFAANHQPGTSVYMNWDTASHSFINSYKDNYTYTSYGKPNYHYDESWDETASVWIMDYSNATRYHYETYGGSTSVDKVADHNGTAALYPVPAVANITVNVTWASAQPFTASVTDMAGKTFTTWTVAATKEYRETFSVSELPAGNYVLTLRGGQGTVSKQFSVVR